MLLLQQRVMVTSVISHSHVWVYRGIIINFLKYSNKENICQLKVILIVSDYKNIATEINNHNIIYMFVCIFFFIYVPVYINIIYSYLV